MGLLVVDSVQKAAVSHSITIPNPLADMNNFYNYCIEYPI
jgi:hypothetical protein